MLATDNTARLCSKCHREQRDQLQSPPAQLRPEFFETDNFRAAFESQHIGKVFKAYRHHPRHLQLFGKALNQELLGRWLGLTQAQVSKLENGKAEQNLEVLRNYARILHVPQHLLWFDLAGQTRLGGRSQTLAVPTGQQGLVVALNANLANEKERIARIAYGVNRTDIAAIDSVAAVLANLRRLEDVTSADAVLPTVLQQGSLVTIMAESAEGQVRDKAVGLLSEIHQYSGWLNIPNKRWDIAQSHLDRASTLAIEVDDPQRLSTALSFLSYKNLRLDDIGGATALNEAASRDSRTDIGLRTYLTFQRAEVLARGGHRGQALAALREADKLTGALPPVKQLPDSEYWYTPVFFHGQKAFVLQALGDTAQARHIAAEAIEMLPGSQRDSEWASRRRKLADLE